MDGHLLNGVSYLQNALVDDSDLYLHVLCETRLFANFILKKVTSMSLECLEDITEIEKHTTSFRAAVRAQVAVRLKQLQASCDVDRISEPFLKESIMVDTGKQCLQGRAA